MNAVVMGIYCNRSSSIISIDCTNNFWIFAMDCGNVGTISITEIMCVTPRLSMIETSFAVVKSERYRRGRMRFAQRTGFLLTMSGFVGMVSQVVVVVEGILAVLQTHRPNTRV